MKSEDTIPIYLLTFAIREPDSPIALILNLNQSKSKSIIMPGRFAADIRFQELWFFGFFDGDNIRGETR